MPAQTQKSSLFTKFAKEGAAAHAKVKDTRVTSTGGGDLPGGIEGGVARLVSITFGDFKEGTGLAGKPYFMAAGVVVHPAEHQGVGIRGLQTRIGPEPICETPTRTRKTLAEHWNWVLDRLAELGLKKDQIRFETVEQVCAALVKKGPYFRFRTWKPRKQAILQGKDGQYRLYRVDDHGVTVGGAVGGPWKTEQAAKAANPYVDSEPRTNHEWGGACTWNPAGAAVAGGNGQLEPPGVEDATGGGRSTTAEEEPTADTSGDTFDEFTSGGEEGGGGPAMVTTGENGVDWSTETDLDKILEGAAAEEEGARSRLSELALEAGAEQDAVDAAESWNDVVDMIRAGQAGEPDEGSEEETPSATIPTKGDVYLYTPIDPKTKKPAVNSKTKKPATVEVEVLSVDKKTSTVTLKNLVTGKPVVGRIPFDRLLQG
jgi:hypothetical protein